MRDTFFLMASVPRRNFPIYFCIICIVWHSFCSIYSENLKRTTMKKTNAIKCLNRAEKALADGIEGIINEMKSRGITILCTEPNNEGGDCIGDPIYAYALDGEFTAVFEREVKGLYLNNDGDLLICADLHNVFYRPEDLESEFSNNDSENVYLLWHNGRFFFDDYLQPIMTATCILRDIDYFLGE